MKVGVFTDGLGHLRLEAALDWLADELPGVRHAEIGTGGYSSAPHCDRERLLADADERGRWSALLEERGFRLAALNVSGNPLEQSAHDRALRETIRLARLLDVDRVVCMSGGRPELAGGAWFPELEEETERYWETRVLPYWTEIAALAATTQTSLRLCLELEPGAAAYNVCTAERLLTVGANLAVNLDPSHFFWQSIDPLAAIRRLRDRVGFAHGKDTVIDGKRLAFDGSLDRNAWRYATAGTGHDVGWWRAFAEELAAVGYDGVVSIEYEDSRARPEESIAKAAAVLADALAAAGAQEVARA